MVDAVTSAAIDGVVVNVELRYGADSYPGGAPVFRTVADAHAFNFTVTTMYTVVASVTNGSWVTNFANVAGGDAPIRPRSRACSKARRCPSC